MRQERAKIHLRAFTISKILQGYTPDPPWWEGVAPPAPTSSTASQNAPAPQTQI
jgi:hypothetical protein